MSGSHRRRNPAKYLQSALECAIRKTAPSGQGTAAGRGGGCSQARGTSVQEAVSRALSSGSLLSRDPSRHVSLPVPSAQLGTSCRECSCRGCGICIALEHLGRSIPVCVYVKSQGGLPCCARSSLRPSEKCPVLSSKEAPAQRAFQGGLHCTEGVRPVTTLAFSNIKG